MRSGAAPEGETPPRLRCVRRSRGLRFHRFRRCPLLLRLQVCLEDVGDAVAEAVDGHAPAVAQLVPKRLHLLDALHLVNHLLQGGAPSQVQGDEAAGKLRHAVLEAAALAEEAEDLEGLAVLVNGDRDEQVAELGLELRRRAGQAAGPGPCRRGHGLSPFPLWCNSHSTASSRP